MRLLVFCLCAGGLLAQSGTPPKPKPEDYEAHGQVRDASLGAEFMIHSFEGEGVTYVAKDYLVVEVAVYPPKGGMVDVEPLAFTLRLDGKKLLHPHTIAMVRSTLEHPEWRDAPRVEAAAGTNGGGVVLGAPRPTGPTPTQPPRPTSPLPPPPIDPGEDPRAPGVPRVQRVSAAELLVQTALPEGKQTGPVSGYLYFPFTGKTRSLKSVELLFEDAVLKLR